MFKINKDDLSIYLTRGDIVVINVTADDNGKPYIFKQGDIVRMTVYEKKNANNVVLSKSITVHDEAESVAIFLDRNDTTIGQPISKPTDYWYDITINPDTYPQTIIGYTEDGPKIFTLFPRGVDTVIDGSNDEATDELINIGDLNGKISLPDMIRGEDGATFIPSVSDNVLSWTNDKGLDNPAPVTIVTDNIKTEIAAIVLNNMEQAEDFTYGK